MFVRNTLPPFNPISIRAPTFYIHHIPTNMAGWARRTCAAGMSLAAATAGRAGQAARGKPAGRARRAKRDTPLRTPHIDSHRYYKIKKVLLALPFRYLFRYLFRRIPRCFTSSYGVLVQAGPVFFGQGTVTGPL